MKVETIDQPSLDQYHHKFYFLASIDQVMEVIDEYGLLDLQQYWWVSVEEDS